MPSSPDTLPGSFQLQTMASLEAMSTTEVVEPPSRTPRPTPAFVLDLSGESLQHDLFATDIIQVGGILRCRWSDARVYGWDAFFAFMGKLGEFTTQDVDGNAFRVDRYLANLPAPPASRLSLARDEDTVTVDFSKIAAVDTVELSDDIYFASPIEPLNWGMWLLHAVPSAKEFLSGDRRGMFGCWCRLPWQRALLSFMGMPDDKILQLDEWKLYSSPNLTFRAYPDMSLYVGPKDRETFAGIAARCLASSAAPRHRRLFISRLGRSAAGALRGLLNEAELAGALEKIGFTVIEPERLAFEDQAALFASANVIVGLGGAGMFNTVFSRPGTKVVTIEASTAFVANHGNIFKALGLEYGVIFGQRLPGDTNWPHHRWTVDVTKAVRQITDFL